MNEKVVYKVEGQSPKIFKNNNDLKKYLKFKNHKQELPKIPYPKSISRIDIQAYLISSLKKNHIDARGDVKTTDGSILDIVVFKKRYPIQIIDVKAIFANRVFKKTDNFTVPVEFVCGLAQAKAYLEKLVKIYSLK